MDPKIIEAALNYHNKGIGPVIAVKKDKTPNDKWKEYQTRDQGEDEIRDSFSRPDAHGLALMTWPRTKFVVLDYDGEHAEEAWSKTGIELPATIRNVTQSGGVHLIFKSPSSLNGLKRDIKLVKADCNCLKTRGKRCGVDFLVNGYFIVPPTPGYHNDVSQPSRPTELPAAVVELAIANQAKEENASGSKFDSLNALNGVPEGERDDTIFRFACKGRGFGLPQEWMEKLVLESARNCDPPFPEKTALEKVRRAYQQYEAGDEWPELQSIAVKRPPVPEFDAELLPDALRDWIVDIAQRMNCPIEYPAVGTVTGLASVIGRQVAIRPKRKDDWMVVPNLWGAIIGKPGVMKSPALQDVLKPLSRLEIEKTADYERLLIDYHKEEEIFKAQLDGYKDMVRKSYKSKDKLGQPVRPTDLGPKPTRRRFIINDSTVEKVGVLLQENPNGFLLFRDELLGWLRGLDREGRESDRAFYLEAWNGYGSFTYDRIGRGTLKIPAVCVSILGAITPDVLQDYLRSTVSSYSGADGLIQRFQLMVWPDATPEWKNVDRWPSQEAKGRAYNVFKTLCDNLSEAGLEKDGPDSLGYLRFSETAQGLFDEWRQDLESKLRTGEEHPMVETHLSKYRSLMPSLALIFHLVEDRGPVSDSATLKAIGWIRLLEAHARRVYSSVAQRHEMSCQLLAQRIQTGRLPDPFTTRYVNRMQWSGLSESKDVYTALETLEDAGWIKGKAMPVKQQGGRPRYNYYINPKLEVHREGE